MDKVINHKIQVSVGKKIYFASDQHFGAPNRKESLLREQIFCDWLDEIKEDAQVLFLLGDLFDFWFEYKHVVPKGFVKVMAKIAQLKEEGIDVYFFVGNHDLWMNDYLEKELGLIVFKDKQEFSIDGKQFLIAHGDGLGPNDIGFKRMKKVFTHPFSNWLFRWLHPDIGVPLGNYMSRQNKLISGEEDVRFLGEEKEWLLTYCKQKLNEKAYDFFVFGHRHLPLSIPIGKATYINLGDWIKYFTFAVYSAGEMSLEEYKKAVK